MTTSDVTFVPASLTLRPPRVAVVFPDDARWRDWAMRALEVSSEYWGGGGFILVPHDASTGEPSPRFAEIVRAYDPDHVVALEIPVADHEEWYPNSIQISGLSGDERAAAIQNMCQGISLRASERARGVVASWCSPMRQMRMVTDPPLRSHEQHKRLAAVDRRDRFRRGLPVTPEPSGAVLAASAGWRSDLGLLAAARAGVVRADITGRPEPGSEVIEWSIRREGTAPESLLAALPSATPGSRSKEVSTVFAAQPGLLQVSRGYVNDMAAVVIGDTGTDFALALAYDRILGRGFWVSSSMLEDTECLHSLRSSLWWLTSQLEQQAAILTVSSASLDDIAIATAARELQAPNYEFERLGRGREAVAESGTVQVRAPKMERGFTELALEEHIGTPVVVPMSLAEDGTLTAMSGLDTPVPSTLMYPVSSGKVPYWYVEVSFAGTATPHGRDLPPSSLLAVDAGQYPAVSLRASKAGVTFNPSSMGFVSSASLLPGRIGRPRLRALSMRSWVEGMANATGLGVRLSSAGRQSELVSRRLGSRQALLDLISASNLPLLRAFVPYERVPKRRDPGSVVIGLDPYLSFEKMATLLGAESAAVDLVDALTVARLLRRGLILGCSDCGRPSFVDADRVSQQYECPQCAASNTLISARWKVGNEPAWRYDLYAPLRELLRTHGDIPLLAAARLRSDSRTYADVPELEFFELDSGQAVAEVDVIANVDDEVVLVEAKVTGAFPNSARDRQTRKLLRVAEALRATRILLATSSPSWKQADINHLQRAASDTKPFVVSVSALAALGDL